MFSLPFPSPIYQIHRAVYEMATPPLIIRNLTSTPIELRLVERLQVPVSNGFGVSNITRNLTKLVMNPTNSSAPRAPSATELATNAESFSREDVNISIEAFGTVKTDIKAGEPASIETLRLTFENDGERYRIDTPIARSASSILTPSTPNPRFQYTAIYLPESSHLTLYSSANLNSWMKNFKDETPLSALSIPGTHNSPTHHRALVSVRCQAVSPREQLENGVRFFDIRVQPESPQDRSKNGLILVHSAFPISLTGNKYFRELVKVVFDFLDQNPSETVIMSIKREGTGDATDEQLSRILRDHYAGDVNRWFTAPRIPTLGEARHKIVLLRRFGLEEGLKQEWDGAGWGIDASVWADNTECATCPSGDVCVQDFYEVLETVNIDKKIEYCKAHLERAGKHVSVPEPNSGSVDTPGKHPFYINFLSASNFWRVGCWPERIAAKINPAIIDHLCRNHDEGGEGKGDGGTGIVVCDWVGNNGNWDLVRCIVGMNAKLEIREKAST